ncbi:related to WHI3-involved in regulation of cell size [Sporisorium reilianum f. sp. reilianum]|uniref:Related to WHI3-involved in regulation of cell size n=1 Tax=Sporisorium reilianum f. sp. reilianum TaxID=72559 RepID=A0A2N8UKR2_9BASI|nr:related to WHI3-involved in regulation of cell size [Sporisorium reilianum f. sp. reilianum]
MPDGAQILDRSSHVDVSSFPTSSTSLRMAPPPPPGIPAPVPASSRSAASPASGPPGLARDPNPPPSFTSFHSSPPLAPANQTAFAAPRPMQPYPRLMSPQPVGKAAAAQSASSSAARSPSPSKRTFNFPIGDPGERWNSIGQVSSSNTNTNRGPAITAQRKPSLHSGLSTSSNAAEPFLGYNELFSPNGTSSLAPSETSKSANAAALSTSDPMNVAFRSGSSTDSRTGFTLSTSHEQDLISHRFGLSPGHYAAGGRDDFASQMGGNPRSVGHDDFQARSAFGPAPGNAMLGLPNPGNLSPRSMMQLHHQHMQMQSQLQYPSQQQPPSHQPPLGPLQQQQQQQQHHHQLGLQGSIGNAAGIASQGGPPEEITTVFIVGFPDDMTEREFANMFLFAKGFEASTLKIPAGLGAIGPNGRLSDGSGPLSAGPGGPYQAVNMPGFDMGGNAGPGWDDPSLPLGLGRAGASDPFSSLASMPGMPNSLGAPGLGAAGGINSASAAAAAGKIKQIIGFAKFRTRAEALEARDALNGRKVDVEKGCVLKTEMAKKNLHTKQRPVLSAPGFAEGGSAAMPPPPGIGAIGSGAGSSGAAASQSAPPPFALGGGPFDARAGPQINGPGGQAGPFGPFGKGPGSFEPFNGPTSTPGDLLSPHEMFGGPEFFSQPGPAALRSSGGGDQAPRLVAPSQPPSSQQQQQQQQQQQGSSGADKWGGSMGPIDYYGPEGGAAPVPASSRGLQGAGAAPSFNTQSGPRPDWPALGSPPPGLYSTVAAANLTGAPQRPGFQRQGSRGTSTGAVGTEQAAAGPGFSTAPGSATKPEEGVKADTNRSSSTTSSAGAEAAAAAATAADAQQSSVTTRFGSLKLGSPPADEDGAKPAHRASSPDLSSPTGGRNVVGDNHPPVNTLFVGNLPSNAASAALSQIEDHLRGVFGSCRGFRQISFRLKSNGPMCFVEFEDVYTASKAMSELNGHSLGGAIKNGGIRLSFSKNPLFRMNSNSAMNATMNGAGASGGGSTPGSGSVA